MSGETLELNVRFGNKTSRKNGRLTRRGRDPTAGWLDKVRIMLRMPAAGVLRVPLSVVVHVRKVSPLLDFQRFKYFLHRVSSTDQGKTRTHTPLTFTHAGFVKGRCVQIYRRLLESGFAKTGT